jgi:hypothetical protein
MMLENHSLQAIFHNCNCSSWHARKVTYFASAGQLIGFGTLAAYPRKVEGYNYNFRLVPGVLHLATECKLLGFIPEMTEMK